MNVILKRRVSARRRLSRVERFVTEQPGDGKDVRSKEKKEVIPVCLHLCVPVLSDLPFLSQSLYLALFPPFKALLGKGAAKGGILVRVARHLDALVKYQGHKLTYKSKMNK